MGVPPAALFLKRQLRTRLTLLKPDQKDDVRRKQMQQHDQDPKQVRTVQPGDHVAVRQVRGSEKWVPGIVVQGLGPVAYMVNVIIRNTSTDMLTTKWRQRHVLHYQTHRRQWPISIHPVCPPV